MKDSIKLILLIAILSAAFYSCKEGGSKESNPIQLSQDTKVEKSRSSEIIILNEKNYYDNLEKGSEIHLEDYLKNREFASTLPLTKIITNELNEEYLIIRYFSGGAHCCVITEVLSKDNISQKYKVISSNSEDGEPYPIKYPFNFYNRHNYFYSCYACMRRMDCENSLSIQQKLKTNKIVTSVVGSKEEYAKCLMNYLSKNYIPELNDKQQDDGEREVILNAVEKLYWAEMDITKIFNIYSEYANDFSDKPELWIEILNHIGMQDSIVSKQQKNLLSKRNNVNNTSEIDRLYSVYKDTKGEQFMTTVGEIHFRPSNISYTFLSSNNKVASIRIGKEQSRERSELIESFLAESTKSKLNNRYTLEENKKEQTTYGSFVKKTYRKGDMYFTTYYENERVQGTYNSTNYRFTYYIEMGAKSRRDKFYQEQYNSKLGQ